MFRVAVSFIVCLLCWGCVSPALRAQREAELKAAIEAHKIPAVGLSEAQIARLREVGVPDDPVVWYRAGLQKDGKTFVCFITSGKTLFGDTRIRVFTGTFESDGSFQRTAAYLLGGSAVIDDCRQRGFDPPVKIVQGF